MDEILNYTPNQDEDFYKVLGCDESSTVEQINAEYKILALACHPDKHPNNPQAAQRFAVLQRAKEILCDGAKRQHYDKWRRSGLTISYSTWCAKHDAIHTSLHWAKPNDDPGRMLTEGPSHHQADGSVLSGNPGDRRNTPGCSRTQTNVLHQFRNYQI